MVLKFNKKKPVNNRRSLITHEDPRSPISEQYRTLRTNIQYTWVDEEIRSLMVTSAGPGEGKSTTVANLAVVYAQQGKRVLLVDTDLRKPTVHYTFNLPNVNGFTSVLTKKTELKDTCLKAKESNLWILSSGPIPPNPAELLSSKAMDEFLEIALEQFDIVMFDTPPVLAVTDAQILANKCDGAVLVVSSGKTGNEEALKAKDLLTTAKGKLLGVVLNNKKLDNTDYYYYYGENNNRR